jgi:hypothetical protein
MSLVGKVENIGGVRSSHSRSVTETKREIVTGIGPVTVRCPRILRCAQRQKVRYVSHNFVLQQYHT